MQKKFPPVFRALLLAVGVVALLVASPVSAAHRSVAASNLVFWVDTPQQASIEKSAAAWGKAPVTVVVHAFSSIHADLKTVSPENAPDIIIGQHDWIGDLVSSGLVVPIYPSAATKAQFPQYALDAFSYGIAVKKLYGAPYAFDNIGLVVNTRLVKVPTSFAQLEREAVAFKNKKSGNLAIAVPQGPGGDAFHMYGFFSGLGGYVFGKNKIGLLDPSDIGVANRTLVSNSSLIDKWNREGLINSKVDYDAAKIAFLTKQAAFWITGPWESDALKLSGLKFKIIQMPKIQLSSVPFLNVQGLMVTKYAHDRGIDTLARDFVSKYMMTPAAQLDLAKANGRAPANITASKNYSNSIASQFGKAGVGGVPVPNIPQMSQVWTELGLAWARSTQGTGATRARVAFKAAAHNIAEKIG
jgi:arabinogalactan oligomer / maltooligosaccharide transport system substrate-binding protein